MSGGTQYFVDVMFFLIVGGLLCWVAMIIEGLMKWRAAIRSDRWKAEIDRQERREPYFEE